MGRRGAATVRSRRARANGASSRGSPAAASAYCSCLIDGAHAQPSQAESSSSCNVPYLGIPVETNYPSVHAGIEFVFGCCIMPPEWLSLAWLGASF